MKIGPQTRHWTLFLWNTIPFFAVEQPAFNYIFNHEKPQNDMEGKRK